MKAPNRRHVLLASIMIITATLAALFFEPLNRAMRIDDPGAAMIRQAREDFGRALDAPGSGNWRKALREQGLFASKAASPIEATRLDETDSDCSGRGAYMIARDPAASALLVSAPHRGSDLHTGTLALQIFGEGNLAAAAFNSAPRRASKACENAADLARSPDNHFTAFSLAFADRYPKGRIVQLHGFEREFRQSQAGSEADVILSNGTQSASEDLLDIADCLSIRLAPRTVLVYPNDVTELGALSNAQGQALRDNGFDRFIHIELSRGFREVLVGDASSRRALLNCLTRGIER